MDLVLPGHALYFVHYGKVAHIESVRYAQDRGQVTHHLSGPGGKLGECGMRVLGRRPPVVAYQVCQNTPLLRTESAQVAVHHEVVCVLVVLCIADVVSDVVQYRGVFQQSAFSFAQSMKTGSLPEDLAGELGNLVRVIDGIIAASGKVHDGLKAKVSARLKRRRPGLQASNKVVDQTLAQGHRAYQQVLYARCFQEGFQTEKGCWKILCPEGVDVELLR